MSVSIRKHLVIDGPRQGEVVPMQHNYVWEVPLRPGEVHARAVGGIGFKRLIYRTEQVGICEGWSTTYYHVLVCGALDAQAAMVYIRTQTPAGKAAQLLVDACVSEHPSIRGRDDEYVYDTLGSALAAAYFAARELFWPPA